MKYVGICLPYEGFSRMRCAITDNDILVMVYRPSSCGNVVNDNDKLLHLHAKSVPRRRSANCSLPTGEILINVFTRPIALVFNRLSFSLIIFNEFKEISRMPKGTYLGMFRKKEKFFQFELMASVCQYNCMVEY